MLRATQLPKARIPSDLQFGIEYEFNHLPNANCSDDAIYSIREILTNRQVPSVNGWQVVSDGSCGLELVSPILTGEEGLQIAKAGLETLRALGARTDSRCGLHIHFSAPNMRRYIRVLTKTLMYAEPVFFASTTGRRYGNHYCQMWCQRHTDVLSGRFAAPEDSWYGNSREPQACDCGDPDCEEYIETSDPDGREDKYHNSRYSAINLHSFFYGTGIELRYFHVPRTSRRLEGWLRMIGACVEYARSGERSSAKMRTLKRLGTGRHTINRRRVQRVLHILKTRERGAALSVESSASLVNPETAQSQAA